MDMIQRETKKYNMPQIRVVDHSGVVMAWERMILETAMRHDPDPMKTNGELTAM